MDAACFGSADMVKLTGMKAPALFLVLIAAAWGETVPVELRYAELNLKNGTVLTPAKILSYDPEAGSVNVLSGKSLKKFDLQLFPNEIVKQLDELRPRRTEAEKVKLQQRMADAEQAAQKRAAQREEDARTEYLASRAAQRTLDVGLKTKEKEREAGIESEMARAAEAYARSYFKYQSDPHSSVGLVLNSEVQLGEPEPVPGWSGRWRVPGTAGLAYATNTGGMLGRKSREFEVLLETTPRGRPKVLEITVK